MLGAYSSLSQNGTQKWPCKGKFRDVTCFAVIPTESQHVFVWFYWATWRKSQKPTSS